MKSALTCLVLLTASLILNGCRSTPSGTPERKTPRFVTVSSSGLLVKIPEGKTAMTFRLAPAADADSRLAGACLREGLILSGMKEQTPEEILFTCSIRTEKRPFRQIVTLSMTAFRRGEKVWNGRAEVSCAPRFDPAGVYPAMVTALLTSVHKKYEGRIRPDSCPELLSACEKGLQR